MNRLALLFILLAAAAMLPLGGLSPQQDAARTAEPAAEPRFLAIDLFVDPRGTPLAAYQLTLTATGATIVGIEGGEHAAFAQAPYYDPAAIQHERVIIAALSTAADLPVAKTRVARVHVMTTGAGEPAFELQLESAGASDASKIDAAASHELSGPKPSGAGK